MKDIFGIFKPGPYFGVEITSTYKMFWNPCSSRIQRSHSTTIPVLKSQDRRVVAGNDRGNEGEAFVIYVEKLLARPFLNVNPTKKEPKL